RDLVHADVEPALLERGAGRGDDPVAIALGVLAERGFRGGRHALSVVRARQPEKTLRLIAIVDARRSGAHAPEQKSARAKDLMPPTATTDRYKWIALSNTTLGVLMATVNSSILLIALPDI